MKVFILLLCAGLLVPCFAEEKANPFGVPLEKNKQKVPECNLSKEDVDFLKKYAFAMHNSRADSEDARKGFEECRERLRVMLCGSAESWKPADFDKRLRLVKELETYDKFMLGYMNLINDFQDAIVNYVANADEDPNAFVRRFKAAEASERLVMSNLYRQIVAAFLEHDKYAKASKQQKVAFVRNWLVPQLKPNAKKPLTELADELEKQ